MSSILAQIRGWAATELRYWEQAALEKIAEGTELSDQDYAELVKYFLQDAGLEPVTARPKLSFPTSELVEAEKATCCLRKIFNLKNVNALPEGQMVEFGPRLTLIYGANGAGKTGFARPLGCAGFARGKRDVLPNANISSTDVAPQADIEISYGGVTETVTWKRGERLPESCEFYVFDSESAYAHLSQVNSLNYSPSGLSLLTRLAELTDRVRFRVREKIQTAEIPHNFQLIFEGDSLVNKAIADLGPRTDLSLLEELSVLSSEEEAQADELERAVAELKLQSVPMQIAKRRQEVNDLGNLLEALSQGADAVSDLVHAQVNNLISKVQSLSEEVSKTGSNQFRNNNFNQTGSEAWFAFIVKAKALADAERPSGPSYPSPGDSCLLCRQPLSEPASELLRKFWAFLLSDVQSRLEQAKALCEDKAKELEELEFDYFGADSSVRRMLEQEVGHLIPAIEARLDSCDARRREMVKSLRSFQNRSAPPLTNLDTADIQQCRNSREADISTLSNSDSPRRLAETEGRLRALKHRQLLGKHLAEIKSHVEKLKWAASARSSLGSTKATTTKHNELFQRLVTSKFTTLFEANIRRFRQDIQIALETRGSKGETVRQIVLGPKKFKSGFTVSQVLSDGEKRAVAIADFLAEASIDPSNNPIILDDPVTSMDDGWKGTLAECLVEEARSRQVIVFTHDLVFLGRIKDHAKKLQVDFVSHWIREENGRPGFVYPQNSPLTEGDFRSAELARRAYSESKNAEPSTQQALLQKGFGWLRSTYEALIVFEIFKDVVHRYDDRISFGQLADVRVDPALNQEIIENMGRLSRHIDAHLHSDKFGSTKPTPADLFKEIETFETIKRKQKELNKPASS
ncbi:MAG TPA: AAA family ATPase [Candidatus Acidoferrales bacterium]|nr:AAA family ATPase [Candidatus Acidoferrales bacterium]